MKRAMILLPLLILNLTAQDFDDTNFGEIPIEMVRMYEEQHYKRRAPKMYAQKKADRKAYETALAADPLFQKVAAYCEKERFRRCQYTKKYVGNSDGILSAMIRTSDEGAALIGTRSAPDAKEKGHVGTASPHLVRFDKSMNLLWEKSYRSKGFLDYEGNSVIQCEDGTFIIHLSAYVHPSQMPTPWILKVSSEGEKIWEVFIRRNEIGMPSFYKMILNDDGSLTLDGGVQAKDETPYEWSGKISASGKLLSAKTGALVEE